MCPHLHSLATVLWMPPGAHSFAGRERWGRQVAYASQFKDRIARGHQGAAKVKARLFSIGGFNPDEWELPPNPKWMRWKTYNRMVERFDRYEAMVEAGLACGWVYRSVSQEISILRNAGSLGLKMASGNSNGL